MKDFNENRYTRAKEKVDTIKSLYSSLFAYCIVIPILAYINYRTTSFLWFVFPALGWGIGLVANWMGIYGYNPIFGRDWEERKIKEFMNNTKF
ncbi:2TM domain-containing protein [Flagellimonas sp. HMM57]|uniref:2TM domain-containing protein n=1 Tax=unclassified Flagellimonas TaxID=2644544 RepID=UPI0013CFEB5C|nr:MULTISPECIES: 2TM domain-containing protein [unclassified Flagellimonas]UII75435.1 2TM domain-containing protein [Flagellimonas sp. HMM57]